MKNIHVLPTENSSRLSYNKDGVLELHRLQWRKNTQNIYITSDEEIKEREWCTDGIYLIQATPKLVDAQGLFDRRDWRKIILTTDQELIKDGVQAIDDKFLEWFVKNQSCEFVEVKEVYFHGSGYYDKNALSKTQREIYSFMRRYKIIIPKEEPKQELPTVNGSYGCTIPIKEPKQETPEEAAERTNPVIIRSTPFGSKYEWVPKKERKQFVEGAKWQQEQDKNNYSEVFEWLANKDYLSDKVEIIQKEFEEFKKK